MDFPFFLLSSPADMKPRKLPNPRGGTSHRQADGTSRETRRNTPDPPDDAAPGAPTVRNSKIPVRFAIPGEADSTERLDRNGDAPARAKLSTANGPQGEGVANRNGGTKAEMEIGEGKSDAPEANKDKRETRMRKVKVCANDTPPPQNGAFLTAVDRKGNEITVKLILAGHPYIDSAASDPASPDHALGRDGNQYYCQLCRGFGDVVCCDGCPTVYHHECVPLHSLSRKSLDNDDDPWFCPNCIDKSKNSAKVRRSRSDKGNRSSSHRRCADCMKTRIDLSLAPCTECGTYVHFPPCREATLYSSASPRPNKVVCVNCLAIDNDDGVSDPKVDDPSERENNPEDNEGETDQYNAGSLDQRSDSDGDDDEGDDMASKNLTKRKRASLMAPRNDSKKHKKKKMKKLKRSSSVDLLDDDAVRQQSIKDDPILQPRASATVQAIPAFCFYLAENRWKIERALSRKHRTFNRLPKGDERNALVAQEAAVWWTKLPPMEHQRYINQSMRDFENRIVLWKEEKSAKEMGVLVYAGPDDVNPEGDTAEDGNVADSLLTYEMHDRLYLSTSVGSKPFKLETDQSYNRVLLDLLHDIRFHPLPMLSVNQPEVKASLDEYIFKVKIPFFEVHGPISTSIGDECLGCTRGWAHFCAVMQERIPAVEHRAKLQPPLSSLMATRIGLGLRPRLDLAEIPELAADKFNADLQKADLHQWRESDEFREMNALPVVPSCSAFDPKERADDMVLFIEESTAMKISEPPRPVYPEKNQHKKTSHRILPTHRHVKYTPGGADEADETLIFNKCGRCRTIIPNDTGCVQCRRAQLVINKSKKAPSSSKNGDGKLLKVHTAMISRVPLREGTGEAQSVTDQALSEALVKERWCPSAIFPPRTQYAPSPKREETNDLKNDSSDDDSVARDEDELSNTKSSAIKDNPTNIEEPAEEERETEPTGSSPEMAVEGSADEVLPTKRSRPARSLSMMFKEAVEPEPDRQQFLKHHRKESAEMQKKTTQIVCYGIVLALMRRDPLHLFEQPVAAEGYALVIHNPIDLTTIRENALSGKYSTLGACVSDARLLCENALAYNPQTSIYYKTAKEMRDALSAMQKRASDWMSTIKCAHSSFLRCQDVSKRNVDEQVDQNNGAIPRDPFGELRKAWPEGVQMLDSAHTLRRSIASDFMRTEENEAAFYGCVAIRRAAAAAEASMAPYTDSNGPFSVVAKRTHNDDEDLRDHVDTKVGETGFPQLKCVSTWREEAIVRLVRKVQKLRLERKTTSENGCSRCDGAVVLYADRKSAAWHSELLFPSRPRKKGDLDVARGVASREVLASGLASAKTCQRIMNRTQEGPDSCYDNVKDACVSVRGSKVHGMGLFADQPFSPGDVVAEYVGEYVVNPVADAREKDYGGQRIQDYQFRLDAKLVIDATKRGGWGRYINHNCSPNCNATIIAGKEPTPHLRRVMIVALRSIELNEEISYDYQFPLELDLSARIPCNCQSDACRGFMNWDLPEKGSNNRALLVQKRGANMRDRIRRLTRPLKRDEL